MARGERPDPTLIGILAGWMRIPSARLDPGGPRTTMLRIQAAKTTAAYHRHEFDEYDVAMSSIQLRQLGEDLIRAADEAEDRETRIFRRRRKRWWLGA
jgi:hypothetical protein